MLIFFYQFFFFLSIFFFLSFFFSQFFLLFFLSIFFLLFFFINFFYYFFLIIFFLFFQIIQCLDERWIGLTINTINFSKAFMTFLDDALKLPTTDSKIFVDDILYDIFYAQLKHLENSLSSGKYKAEVTDFQNKIEI